FEPKDFAYALGWHVKTDRIAPHVDVKYLDEFSGYLWLFPRTDHVSYGVASGFQETTPARLKAKLINFIETQDRELARELKTASGNSTPRANFYAAMIPSLDVSTWDRLQACDAKRGWALVGDAAGFVDPLTGEGIYYAIKSADLLTQALVNRVEDFDEMWRAEVGAGLRRAAGLQHRFFPAHFSGGPLTPPMGRFAPLHPRARAPP